MSKLEKLEREVKRLTLLLNNVDFHLDEFSSGFCSVPRRAKPEAVVKAVDEAMGTLRVELARAQMQAHWRKEALTQVKVDHLNKVVKLPLETHAMVENAISGAPPKKKGKRK